LNKFEKWLYILFDKTSGLKNLIISYNEKRMDLERIRKEKELIKLELDKIKGDQENSTNIVENCESIIEDFKKIKDLKQFKEVKKKKLLLDIDVLKEKVTRIKNSTEDIEEKKNKLLEMRHNDNNQNVEIDIIIENLTNKFEELKNLLNNEEITENKLLYCEKELLKLKDSVDIEKKFEKVAYGVYVSPETWEDNLYILSLRCPQGVYSHDEALYYHGLIDREPMQRTLTIYTGYGTSRLVADGIKVFLTRDNDENIPSQDSIKKLVADNKAEMLVDLDVVNTDTKGTFGAKVYYSTTESAIIAKSIEKHLSNNYISKVSASEKQGNFSQLSDKLPQVRVVSGNIHDKVDVDILNDSVAQKQYISALKEGIEGYLYYQINIDNYNAKRKEQLLNLPQKGLTIPMYYMKQDAYKNISYGTDGKKTIEENGDAIVSLAMISNYLGLEGASVEDISSWAGSKYYIKNQGTQPTIVSAFAKKYNVKADEIDTDNTVQNIEKALKENKPVLIRLKSGLFGDKVTYKVIRGYEDEKFYINDPNDDDVKLTSYNGFTENDVKNNIAQAWAISK